MAFRHSAALAPARSLRCRRSARTAAVGNGSFRVAQAAERFRACGVTTPRTLVASAQGFQAAAARLGFPLVVKLPDGCASRGVFKAEDRGELTELAERLNGRSALFVLQEYTPTAFDWRIGALNGSPLFARRYWMVEDHWQARRSPAELRARRRLARL